MTSFSVTQIAAAFTPGAVGIWTLIAGLVYAYFRFKPLMQKLKNESDGSLRGDLMKRINELENKLNAEQRHCEERIKEIEDKYNALIRIITQASVNKVLQLNDDVPEDIRDMAARVNLMLGRQGREQ